MEIRLYRASDLSALYVINQQSTPGVGHEDSAEGLARWINLATCLVAADDADIPLGFITLLPPGTGAYDSQNLRWFEDYVAKTGRRLIYVDRIALAETARGQGIGEQLYKAAYARFSDHDEIGCEVNTAPDNPGSHRFHKRLGFNQVGTRAYDQSRKGVAYYVKTL